MYEHIPKLLLVSTGVIIFYVLTTYWLVDSAGNGGEYWEFGGRASALAAAKASYDSGDYRFLKVSISSSLDDRRPYVPGVGLCNNPEFGPDWARPSTVELMHGQDSLRLADEFARSFSIAMAEKLNESQSAECVILLSR